MRRPSTLQRTLRAALIALAAGGLVAVDNPAPAIGHAAEVAMTSANHLAHQSAAAVTARLHG